MNFSIGFRGFSAGDQDMISISWWKTSLSQSCLHLSQCGHHPVIRIVNSTRMHAFSSWVHRQPSKWIPLFFFTVNTTQLLQHRAPVVKCIYVLETFLVSRFCVSLQAACPLFPEPPYLQEINQRFFSEWICAWRVKVNAKKTTSASSSTLRGQKMKACQYMLSVWAWHFDPSFGQFVLDWIRYLPK